MVSAENQVRHLFVVDDTTNLKQTPDFCNFWLEVENALGETERTDLVNSKKVLWANHTPAAKMQRRLSVQEFIPGAAVVPGETYVVKVEFSYYKGHHPNDTYAKYATATAGNSTTMAQLLAELAVSLTKSLSREIFVPLDVYLATTLDTIPATPVDPTKSAKDYTGAYKSIILVEKEQPWHLGRMQEQPLLFSIIPTTITNNKIEEPCGTTKDLTATKGAIINNGKKTADMEYFLHGERGDIYRGQNYPHDIETKLLVDPTQAYDWYDLHYYTDEANENIQKSEKTLTLVGSAAHIAALKAKLDKAVKGESIASLDS